MQHSKGSSFLHPIQEKRNSAGGGRGLDLSGSRGVDPVKGFKEKSGFNEGGDWQRKDWKKGKGEHSGGKVGSLGKMSSWKRAVISKPSSQNREEPG